ncbi:sodium-coupled monocarboxylate transporter 1 isoform X2 [Scaptodrosophila lebanonensis]|uniref:Sodium-coupled monocarboxylate transporter 1 isoform X2 n=1 Tax=Drosophila lebanonensis TaxID=7225 RepID=A0A6J2T9S2_DROLE|nr:sodium-coupled monocarboxylate transporter 1 isoform X2 [Scaptodrosophila lebanonensis]
METTTAGTTQSTIGSTMAVKTVVSTSSTPDVAFISSTPAFSPETSSSTSGSPSIVEKVNVKDLSSSLQHFGFVDYFVFVAMLVVCAFIGFYFGFIEKKKKKTKGQVSNNEKDAAGAAGIEERRGSEALDYLVGGRKMKVFPVALSLVASFVSGISLLGTSTEIYVYGTQYAFILITLAISGIISWYIFLPVFCNLQLTSTYEYFELRFNRVVRLLGSILFTFGTLIWLPIVIYVPALAFNQVTGINIHIITPVVCLVCIFYTTVGGLKAVVWTDVIQTIIMVGAIVFVIVKGTIDVGGLGVVWQRNYDSGRMEWPELSFDHKTRISLFAMLIGNIPYGMQNFGGNQVITQRYLSLPGLKEVKHAFTLFITGITLLNAICFYNGLLLYATYHDCDPLTTKLAKAKDQLVPLLVMELLKDFPGLSGLFVAGVFSAALSSLSTGLNSLAAVVLEDYIKPLRKKKLSEHQTAIVMRASTVLIGVLSVCLVFVVESMGTHVMQLSMTMASVAMGPLLGLFLIGLLLPRLNSKSALTGACSSFIIMTWVCLKGQLALSSGELIYTPKPVSTSGCDYGFESLLHMSPNGTTPEPESSTPGSLSLAQEIYHMSFLLYCTVGSALAIVIAQLSSLVFGQNKPGDIDIELLAPCIRRFHKTQYASVNLDEAAEAASKP